MEIKLYFNYISTLFKKKSNKEKYMLKKFFQNNNYKSNIIFSFYFY